MRLVAAALFLIGLICISFSERTSAFWQSRDSNYNIAISSGGSTPTWTGADAAINNGCLFSAICSVLTQPVTTGTLVVFAIVNNQGTADTPSMTACGTSLSNRVGTGTIPAGYTGVMFYGNVTGGTCTITVSFAGSGSFQDAGFSWGTLNNLTSMTPGTSCLGNYQITQNSPYPCTSSLTVASGGFGIVGFGQNQIATMTGGGGVTSDASATTSSGDTIGVAIGHMTASGTPQYTGGNFATAYIIGAPWR